MITEFHKCTTMIENSLCPLDQDQRNLLLPMLGQLLAITYVDLRKAVVGNPIEHHPIVLSHMMEISMQEDLLRINVKRAAALSLLHDISSVEKITKQMIKEARKVSAARADTLELRRQQNRILHMREGSAIAHRRLLELNESLEGIAFDAEDIDTICEVIRIHDNPSLDIPIHRENWLAVAFREADRLWMLTEEGIRADLERGEEKNVNDDAACGEQLEFNMRRFREERALYRSVESTEGPFCDNETFFRTQAGHAIYRRLYQEGKKRYRLKTT